MLFRVALRPAKIAPRVSCQRWRHSLPCLLTPYCFAKATYLACFGPHSITDYSQPLAQGKENPNPTIRYSRPSLEHSEGLISTVASDSKVNFRGEHVPGVHEVPQPLSPIQHPWAFLPHNRNRFVAFSEAPRGLPL